MTAVYNEIEPFACGWLEKLVEAGHISPGRVERRSIRDLVAADVRTARQAHFFAGIGVWSYALRLAGWPDDVPVWTGSCPCQPFSQAGKQKGFDDSRHLWPEWFRLIRECLPPVIFGEQVAGPAGLVWFDAVQADLEGAGYAVGAADLCAASVGAPHIRQRLYFCAVRANWVADDEKLERAQRSFTDARAVREDRARFTNSGDIRRLADDERNERGQVDPHTGRSESGSPSQGLDERFTDGSTVNVPSRLADDDDDGFSVKRSEGLPSDRNTSRGHDANGRSEVGRERERERERGFWDACDWIPCRDGKNRPVEPGTFPLAHGAPARVGRLRGYGNAIVAPLAAEFIRAVMDLDVFQ